MRLIVVAVLAIAALSVIGTGSAAAQLGTISIEPANPTSEDEVLITITAGTPCIVTPTDQLHAIEEQKITITIIIDQDVCLAAVSAITVTENVGKLAPGIYDVEAIVDMTNCCGPAGQTPGIGVYRDTFGVTGPTPSPAPSPSPSPGALPVTGGAPLEQDRAPLAVAAALALAVLGATAIVSRARASR